MPTLRAILIFPEDFLLFSPSRGSFLALRLWDKQAARVYTTAQVWVPGGLRGAFSGASKLRNLANNQGGPFQPAINIAKQAHGKPRAVIVPFFQGFSRVRSNLTGRVGRVGSADPTRPAKSFRCVDLTRSDPRNFEILLTRPDPTREIKFLLTRPNPTCEISKPFDPT